MMGVVNDGGIASFLTYAGFAAMMVQAVLVMVLRSRSVPAFLATLAVFVLTTTGTVLMALAYSPDPTFAQS